MVSADEAWERTQDELAQAGRSDGQPLEPPTPERVERGFSEDASVVAGGVGVTAACLPTWSGGTRAVSRKVPASRADPPLAAAWLRLGA